MRLSKFIFIKKGSYQITGFEHYTVKIYHVLIYMKVIILYLDMVYVVLKWSNCVTSKRW